MILSKILLQNLILNLINVLNQIGILLFFIVQFVSFADQKCGAMQVDRISITITVKM